MKVAIALVLAVLAGVAVGLIGKSFEFSGVKESFSVHRALLDSNDEVQKASDNPHMQPVAHLEGPPVYDFGRMEKGEKMSHEFWFQNTGETDLTLELIKKQCTCTLSDLQGKRKTVKPFERYPVKLTWESEDYRKLFSSYVIIQTNDPRQPTIKLTVKGIVVQPIRPDPQEVVFNQVVTTQGATSDLFLYGFKYDDLKIDKAEFVGDRNKDLFELSHDEIPKEKLPANVGIKSGHRIKVTAKPGLPIGPIRQTIRLHTNKEIVDVPVKGEVTGAIYLSLIGAQYSFDDAKNELDLGTFQSGAEVTAKLLLGTKHVPEGGFEVTVDDASIEPSTQHIQVKVLPKTKIGALHQFPLQITIPHECPNVSLSKNPGKFIVKTNHPEAKEVAIYVKFSKTE